MGQLAVPLRQRQASEGSSRESFLTDAQDQQLFRSKRTSKLIQIWWLQISQMLCEPILQLVLVELRFFLIQPWWTLMRRTWWGFQWFYTWKLVYRSCWYCTCEWKFVATEGAAASVGSEEDDTIEYLKIWVCPDTKKWAWPTSAARTSSPGYVSCY